MNKAQAVFKRNLRGSGLVLGVGGGFDVRIPAENELLGDGNSIIPAEKLMPEQNLSVNASLLYDLVGTHPSNLQIELGGYYMHLRDIIRYGKGLLGAQYQNFGEMRTLGAELEIKADVLPFLYLYGNVNYQDLRDVREHEEGSTIPNPTKGKRMPNIPYFMANSGLEFHRENLFGGRTPGFSPTWPSWKSISTILNSPATPNGAFPGAWPSNCAISSDKISNHHENKNLFACRRHPCAAVRLL